MEILLFGKNGQLGWELQRSLATLGHVTALDYPEIDFSRPDDLKRIVDQTRPQIILNAAAYTAVDRAESEPEKARAINAAGPGILAAAARVSGAALIHISTDYVYDGQKGSPYVETDSSNPLNVYGQTKLEGDQAVEQAGGAYLILRTSWVYSTRQAGFVSKVLQWGQQQETLRMVTDQVGCPTWARMLAEISAQIIAKGGDDPYTWIQKVTGLYHLAGDGYASRLEWAEAILACDPQPEKRVTRQVLPALTEEFPTPARRPLFSALDCSRFSQTFQLKLPPWRDALRLAMQTG